MLRLHAGEVAFGNDRRPSAGSPRARARCRAARSSGMSRIAVEDARPMTRPSLLDDDPSGTGIEIDAGRRHRRRVVAGSGCAVASRRRRPGCRSLEIDILVGESSAGSPVRAFAPVHASGSSSVSVPSAPARSSIRLRRTTIVRSLKQRQGRRVARLELPLPVHRRVRRWRHRSLPGCRRDRSAQAGSSPAEAAIPAGRGVSVQSPAEDEPEPRDARVDPEATRPRRTAAGSRRRRPGRRAAGRPATRASGLVASTNAPCT